MVVIRRKQGQELWIGGVHIVIADITRGSVAVGIDVPREVPIFRDSPTGKINKPADVEPSNGTAEALGATP